MKQIRILVFAGSAREGSHNKKLAIAAARLIDAHGAAATVADLADYPAPIYNGDLESSEGIPQSMRDLKAIMKYHDGLVVSCPEYNGHVPPLLVNTFSWLSRREEDENSLAAFSGKKAAILAASPGQLGGIRVIPRLRDMLAELHVMVVPGSVAVPKAASAFNADGSLEDARLNDNLEKLIDRLIAACNHR